MIAIPRLVAVLLPGSEGIALVPAAFLHHIRFDVYVLPVKEQPLLSAQPGRGKQDLVEQTPAIAVRQGADPFPVKRQPGIVQFIRRQFPGIPPGLQYIHYTFIVGIIVQITHDQYPGGRISLPD